jgi:hypothetical protein
MKQFSMFATLDAASGGSAPSRSAAILEDKIMTVKPIPDGFHSVTPYLFVNSTAKLLDFVKQPFTVKRKSVCVETMARLYTRLSESATRP